MIIRILTFLLFLCCICFCLEAQEFATPFENNSNNTATYEECIGFYKELAQKYPQIRVEEVGATDIGLPLHLIILSSDLDFDPASLRHKNKRILFINNGIHPGEPEGIDATMMLFRDILRSDEKREVMQKVVLVTIPVYNTGGALNRNSHTRANQNGPESYGFRGNAKNLDLNRDFIKCDSKNAQSFNKVFSKWQPDLFVDTHTSNGADYPYTITFIAPQKDKLETPLREFSISSLIPSIYQQMKKRNWEICPYVHAPTTPEEGIHGFLDLPRYSSGYAGLHQSIGITVETHMLKPFRDRVWATYHFLDLMVKILFEDGDKLALAREKAFLQAKTKKEFALNWKLDPEQKEFIDFKGYEAKYKLSDISGESRLYYDQQSPWQKKIPFYDTYLPSIIVEKPVAYLIPQAYEDVIERLRWNGVEIKRLVKDADIEATFYSISDYKTTSFPYESHYLHYDVQVEKRLLTRKFRKGDYVIYVNQPLNRYIVETLEPQAADSYFAWNFFDGILMRKEYYSDYVFEDLAAQYLKKHPDLKDMLDKRKENDPEFAESAKAQLDFIYKNSPWHESTHQLYPVARIEKPVELSLE